MLRSHPVNTPDFNRYEGIYTLLGMVQRAQPKFWSGGKETQTDHQTEAEWDLCFALATTFWPFVLIIVDDFIVKYLILPIYRLVLSFRNSRWDKTDFKKD